MVMQLHWPIFALPYQPLNDDLEQGVPEPYEVSDFEQGLPRTRRIFQNAPTEISMSWAFTNSEFKVWKGFRNAVGAGTFIMPIFRDMEYVDVTAVFVPNSVKQKRNGGEWIVSCKIKTMDNVSATLEQYGIDLIMHGWDGTLDDLMALIHDSIHVHYPANIP